MDAFKRAILSLSVNTAQMCDDFQTYRRSKLETIRRIFEFDFAYLSSTCDALFAVEKVARLYLKAETHILRGFDTNCIEIFCIW